MVQRAIGSASRRVRRFSRHGNRALLYLYPQILDGDVAPQKSVFHDLEFGLETIELISVVAKAVSGPGAEEEREEAMEHAQT